MTNDTPPAATVRGRRARGRLVALAVLGVAVGALAVIRRRRIDAATRALHEEHGPPGAPPR